jgi:hypothetical protein
MKQKNLSKKVASIVIIIVTLGAVMAFTLWQKIPSKAEQEARFAEMLKSEKYDELAEMLQKIYTEKEFNDVTDAIAQAIAKDASHGLPLIDRLNKKSDLLSKSLEAELLMKVSTGVDMKPWELKKIAGQLDLVTTNQIAERAVKLLNHNDPIIRGLAEFAISNRVALENAESLKEFPGKLTPDWYPVWIENIEGDKIISLDYSRQATEQGIHRSLKSLKAEAEKVLTRSVNLRNEIEEKGNKIQLNKADDALQKMKKTFAELDKSDDLLTARKKYIDLRIQGRAIVMQNPGFDFQEIVYAMHYGFDDFGNITNGGKSYVIKPGGDLFIKNGFNPASPAKALIEGKLGPGHSRGFELHYDADRILFSFAPQPQYYQLEYWESDQGFDDKVYGMSQPNNLYEISLDTKEIKQLTNDPLHIDIEPTYLPNGDIVFSSDRGEFGSQCSGNYFQNKRIVNRYRMSADGSNVRAISNNKDFDRYNHVLDNGQLIYTRWEYQERHLYYVHNLWVSKPDGSMADAIYKEHMNAQAPMALRDARQIYGTDKLIAIGCGHHEWEQGAVTLIDPKMGTNDPDGMTILTPGISKREGGIGKGKIPEGGGIPDNGGLYQQPFALSEFSFLVAFSYNYPRAYTHGFNFGLYYIDVYGNKEIIHRDPVLSVWYPVALKQRPVPPVVPDSPGGEGYATIYMTNVYQGMEDVEQGEIKHIRIAHHTEWPAAQVDNQPHNYNHLHYTPSGSWSRTLGMSTWSPARVIGTVPVEEDGSAYFKVPSDVPVYFQALDENLTEVRRMRSFITFGSGETRGCTGCHETRDEAPMTLNYVPKALLREPSQPEPPSWGDTTLPDYEDHIHQIFANNCVSCHGVNNPAGGLEFSSRRIDGYYQAYRTLFGLKATDPTPVQELKAFLLTFGEGHNVVVDKESLIMMEENRYPGQLVTISNKFSDASVTKVREFGSGNSILTEVLLSESHQKHVKLSEKDWEDLVTWIDLNAPYWGSFVDKEPVRKGGKPVRVKIPMGEPFTTQK